MFKWLSVLIFVITQASGQNESIACCPKGLIIFHKMQKCVNLETNETVPLRLTCKNEKTANFQINSEGNVELDIYLHPDVPHEVFGPSVACAGNETNVSRKKFRSIVLLCVDENTQIVSEVVYGICMIVSVVFLALTAIIYACFKEIRDLQGISIINFCGSLAIGLAILSIMKLMEYSDKNLCATRGFLTYFFIITAFFWTNAISIQILRSTWRPSVDNNWKEIGWYALYAWGCPTILTIIMAIINYHPGSHSRPGIGLNHCWFFDIKQQWYYMYSVMTIMVSVNILIFIYTSTIIWRHTTSGDIRATRYRLTMTIRLIFVMGLLWAFEMISSLMEDHIVWSILNVINTLQGPLIFLVLVVFRKRAIKAMLRHGWLDCIAKPVERYLAAGDDAEEKVIQHTDILMSETNP